MASPSTILIAFVLVYASWNLQALYANYRKARQSGFPVLVTLVDPNNLIWIIFSVAFRPVLAQYLPSFIYDRVIPTIYGWEFLHRGHVFDRLGSTFVLVTSGKNELWVADPEIAHSILTRRHAFLQQEIASRIIGMFGKNLTSTDGDDWQRQRKIVAPLLNERISRSVWEEGSRQASGLLASFAKAGSIEPKMQSKEGLRGETDATIAGVRSIAINVLGSVAYGQQQSWQQETNKAPPGYRLAYMDAIIAVVENLMPAGLLPAKLLSSPVMPKSIQRIGIAVEEFPRHVKQLLETERASERPNQANLLSTLVTASDAEGTRSTATSSSKSYLSESELAGNLFQFTVAGFDTTSNTMAYAITLLAIHPEWQDWIREEIHEVTNHKGLQYEAAYPALKRCLALMFEVLRLYTPVAHIARSTKAPQEIPNPAGPTHLIPANTTVYVSGTCMHVSRTLWGDDALIFRPTRWLRPDGSFLQPPRSSFLPWSTGPRNCPGQKMAEVEFVAVMMTMFGSWTVKPVVYGGETVEMARERLCAVMADSQPRTTLQMNRPRDVVLRWEEVDRKG